MKPEIQKLAEECGFRHDDSPFALPGNIYTENGDEITSELSRFADALLEMVDDMYIEAMQSDLENGVKSLNDHASEEFVKRYPELHKFPKAIRSLKSGAGGTINNHNEETK